MRLLVGGVGASKTPRLAGTYADEFNVYPGPDLSVRIDRAREAAAVAGRDPDALMLSSAGQVFGAESEAELERRLDSLAAKAEMTREELAAQLKKRQTPVATYERLGEQFAEMEALGITRFYVQGGYDPETSPELLEAVSGASQ